MSSAIESMDIAVTSTTLRRPAQGLGQHTIIQYLLLLAREARVVVLLVYLARSIAAIGATSPYIDLKSLMPVIISVVSMMFSVAGIYLYNGLTDVEQDRINASSRPLATGELTQQSVRRTLRFLVIAVAAAAFVLPLTSTACNVAMLVLGWAYSGRPFQLKRYSNLSLLVAAIGAALPYISVAAAAPGALSASFVTSVVLLSAWVWAGGATKDFSDVTGDAAAGRKTLPIRLGERRARAAVAGRVAAVATLTAVAAGAGLCSSTLVLAPLCAAILMVGCKDRAATDGRHDRRRLYRLFMVTQFGLNTAVGIAPLAV